MYLLVILALQSLPSNPSVSVHPHYGFIIPHSKAIREQSYSNPWGLEVNLSKLHTSIEKWQVFNSYWYSGLDFRYINFGNPDVTGSAFLANIYAEPVLLSHNRLLITMRGGAGLSYHTRVYDLYENPENQFFSSRISFPVYIDARFRYRISEKSNLLFSLNYNHISNGGTRQPNYGMNFPTISMGIEHFRSQVPYLEKRTADKNALSKPSPSILFQMMGSVKVSRETPEFPQKTSFIWGAAARYHRPLGHFYGLNTGIEYIRSGFVKEMALREGKDVDPGRLALCVGQDLQFSRVVLTQHFGIYLYSPYKARNPVYQKYEFAYRVNQTLDLMVFVKAHLQVAEIMGLGFNYRINPD